jgi:hypothetical protein
MMPFESGFIYPHLSEQSYISLDLGLGLEDIRRL